MPSHENSAEVVLALDVGGTYIKSALFCTGRMIRRLPLVPSRSDSGKAEIAAAIQAAIAQAGTFSRLAVSVPGPFDYQDGIFRMTHKFAAVNGCSFQELSGGVSGTFLHDADAFLLGELIHGAARGFQICGGVTLGTGLGSALAINGDLQNGSDGSPAEQVKLWNRPFRNGIGEDYVSSRSLLTRFPAESVKAIADEAKQGNETACAAWLDYGSALYELLAEWTKQLHPEVIVVGGKIANDLPLLGAIPAGLPIRQSLLGEDAALYGAYEAALREKDFSVPKDEEEEYLRRAILSLGSTIRLNHFFQKAERGSELTVGVFGGSITQGAACDELECCYHGILLQFLQSRFPQSRFTLVNAGIGATASNYGALRVERDLLSRRPDLVILEFAVNDFDTIRYAHTYEGVVRQILKRPTCALLLLFMMHNTTHNAQRFQSMIGRHYGLPMVSYRDALTPDLATGKILWEELSPDSVHPRSAAHTFAGKLLVGLLEQILSLPDHNAPTPPPPLPAPLFSADYESCFLAERETLVPRQFAGWERIPADKTHAGCWFSQSPGSSLVVEFKGVNLMFSYWGWKGNAGRVLVQVDEQAPVEIDSFFSGDWGGGKQFWQEIASSLSPGTHTLRVTLTHRKTQELGGNEFYVCAIGGIKGRS